MRLLFLYHQHQHAEPILRCRELLCGFGVMLDTHECPDPETAAGLLSRGGDAILVHQELMSEAIVGQPIPVAMLERIDGAQIASRSWVPTVRAVLKSYMLRPREMNNEYNGRVSAHRIKAAGAVVENTRAFPGLPPQLLPDELAKLRVCYGFGSYARLLPLRNQFVDLDAPRPYRLQFRGTIEYAKTEIEHHRRQAAVAVGATANMWPGEVLHGASIGYREYCREMFLSRCVLSPWGFGESCHRDYEAMLMGAVVIKPDTDYVDSWPDIYHAGETYIACALDFSDVAAITRDVTDNWPAYKPMRERARALVLEAGDTPALASRLAVIFREVFP